MILCMLSYLLVAEVYVKRSINVSFSINSPRFKIEHKIGKEILNGHIILNTINVSSTHYAEIDVPEQFCHS